MELAFTLVTKQPKQQESYSKKLFKVLILTVLILTHGIDGDKLMEFYVEQTVTVTGLIQTLNVNKSDHLAGH